MAKAGEYELTWTTYDAAGKSVVMETIPMTFTYTVNARKEQSLDDFIAQKAERDAMPHVGSSDLRRFVGTGATTEHDKTQPATPGLVVDTLRDATKHCRWPTTIVDHGDVAMVNCKLPSGSWREVVGFRIGLGADWDYADLVKQSANARVVVDNMNAMACHECDGKGQVRGEIFLAEDTCKGCNGSGLRT